jgi:hypothetical protein
MAHVGGVLDRLVLPACIRRLGEAFGFKMMRVGVRSGKLALSLVTPLIRHVGVAFCRSDGGFRSIIVSLL